MFPIHASPSRHARYRSLTSGRLRDALCAAVLTAVLAGSAHAQTVPPATSPPATSPTPPSSVPLAMPAATPVPAAATALAPLGYPPVPLLWKMSDADNAVYLLGSFHLLRPDDYPLSNDVNAAFADARALVFELPPAEMASPQLGVQMAQAALRTDGTTLDSQLSPATRAKLVTWLGMHVVQLQTSGLTPQALQKFEPWFVALMVTLGELAGHGLDPALGVDRHFMDAAAAAGKPSIGFETGAEQVAFLDGMATTEQLQFLDEALSPPSEGDEDPDTLHAAWRAGDADALWNGMAAEMKSRYPDLYQRINVSRNDAWLPKVESLLARPGSDNTLVVVGSLHLIGADGIVAKLRAKGYAVERICSVCVEAGQAVDVSKVR
ncbi:MAG: TraB/GumN family protein [Luteimonas sp.]